MLYTVMVIFCVLSRRISEKRKYSLQATIIETRSLHDTTNIISIAMVLFTTISETVTHVAISHLIGSHVSHAWLSRISLALTYHTRGYFASHWLSRITRVAISHLIGSHISHAWLSRISLALTFHTRGYLAFHWLSHITRVAILHPIGSHVSHAWLSRISLALTYHTRGCCRRPHRPV